MFDLSFDWFTKLIATNPLTTNNEGTFDLYKHPKNGIGLGENVSTKDPRVLEVLWCFSPYCWGRWVSRVVWRLWRGNADWSATGCLPGLPRNHPGGSTITLRFGGRSGTGVKNPWPWHTEKYLFCWNRHYWSAKKLLPWRTYATGGVWQFGLLKRNLWRGEAIWEPCAMSPTPGYRNPD